MSSSCGGEGRARRRHSASISRSRQRRLTAPPPSPAEMASREDVIGESLPPIRHLEIFDHSKTLPHSLKFLHGDLLVHLAACPPLSSPDFRLRFDEITALGSDHVICVTEDFSTGRIITTGNVFIEKKSIHGCGKVGDIEDVDVGTRGWHLGQRLVQYLVDHAEGEGCYKVILDCATDQRDFIRSADLLTKSA